MLFLVLALAAGLAFSDGLSLGGVQFRTIKDRPLGLVGQRRFDLAGLAAFLNADVCHVPTLSA